MTVGPPIDHDVAGQRVLVTGGAGFVGHHLAGALAPDNEVRVVDDLSTGSRESIPDGVEFVRGDVRDEGALAAATDDVDLIFHLAAQVSVERSVEAPVETTATNVTGTVGVLEAARQAEAGVVLASSAAVYGTPETVPIAEAHPTEPLSPYGFSKLAAERAVELYAGEYGLDATALRLFNVYGPGQPDGTGVVATFIAQAKRNAPITVAGDGEQTRDFVHVRDVVRANLLAANADAAGEAINVGTGERTAIEDLASTIRDVVGANSPIVTVPSRTGDIRHSRADVSKARERLDYVPRVSLESGLTSLGDVAVGEH